MRTVCLAFAYGLSTVFQVFARCQWLRHGLQALCIASFLFVSTFGVPVPWIDQAWADEVERTPKVHTLVLEAEQAQWFLNRPGRRWERGKKEGRQAISLAGNTRVPEADEERARLEFDVFFPEPGAYYIWVRGLSHSLGQPIQFGLDGERIEGAAGITLSGDGFWQWHSGSEHGRAFVIAPSSTSTLRAHRLQVFAPPNAELHLDRILLTTNAAYVPESVGPEGNNGLTQWQRVAPLEPATTLALEAEHYVDRIDANTQVKWQEYQGLERPAPTPEAAQADVMGTMITPEPRSVGSTLDTAAPELNYTVDIPHEGKFLFWARGRQTKAGKGRLTLGLNGTPLNAETPISFNSATWRWQQASDSTKPIELHFLKPGPHQIQLWAEGDGLQLDRWLLTADIDLLPLGSGPLETSVQSLIPSHTLALEAECPKNWQAEDSQDRQSWLHALPAGASKGYSLSLSHLNVSRASDAEIEPSHNETVESDSPEDSKSPVTWTYPINLSEAGDYTLWVRAQHNGLGKTPRLAAQFRPALGNPKHTLSVDKPGQWQWVKAQAPGDAKDPFNLSSAGNYKLQLTLSSSNVWIDQILLSPNPDFIPRGKGPQASLGFCHPAALAKQKVLIDQGEGDTETDTLPSTTPPEALAAEEQETKEKNKNAKKTQNRKQKSNDKKQSDLPPIASSPASTPAPRALSAAVPTFRSAAISTIESFPKADAHDHGLLEGSFSVSQRGAARYSMPLKLPNGRGGLKPSLSVRYNSQGGNGLLGWGWQLHGLAMITRCRKNFALDGMAQNISFSDRDQYCLNGQRLALTSGSHSKKGARYRLAIDNGTLYEIDRANSNGPLTWKAYTENGRILSFGNPNDTSSPASAGGMIRGYKPSTTIATRSLASNTFGSFYSWYLHKVADQYDNHYIITYNQNTGGPEDPYYVQPKKIQYANGDGNVDIEFIYVRNLHAPVSFTAGFGYVRTHRLKTIKITPDENLQFRYEYNFRYEHNANTYRYRLLGAQYCHVTSSNYRTCQRPKGFSWGGKAAHGFKGALSLGKRPNSDSQARLRRQFIGDFNGDGRDELMYSIEDETFINRFGENGDELQREKIEISFSDVQHVLVFDVNQDGRDDLVQLRQKEEKNEKGHGENESYTLSTYTKSFCVWYGTDALDAKGCTNWISSSSFEEPTSAILSVWSMDVNGDGRVDLLYYEYDPREEKLSEQNTKIGFKKPSTHYIKAVLNLPDNQTRHITWHTRSGNDGPEFGNVDPSPNYFLGGTPMDIDSDGRMDLVFQGQDGQYFAMTDRNGDLKGERVEWYHVDQVERLVEIDPVYPPAACPTPTPPHKTTHQWPGGHWRATIDVNGDGRLDLIERFVFTEIHDGRNDIRKHETEGFCWANGAGHLIESTHRICSNTPYSSPPPSNQRWGSYKWSRSEGKTGPSRKFFGGRYRQTIHNMWVTDIDKDGRQDILYYVIDRGRQQIKWIRNQPNGQPSEPILWFDAQGRSLPSHAAPGSYNNHSLLSTAGPMVDRDGDGNMEIILSSTPPPAQLTAEFKATSYIITNSGQTGNLKAIRWSHNENCAANGGGGAPRTINVPAVDPNQHWVMDVNGDGLTDLVFNEKSSAKRDYYALINDGQGGAYRRHFGSRGFHNPDAHWPMDINEDGRTDLVYRSGNTLYAIVANPSLFYQEEYPSSNLNTVATVSSSTPVHTFPGDRDRNRNTQLADINGDGYREFITTSHTELFAIYSHQNNDRITQIGDEYSSGGLINEGKRTISYLPFTNTSTHSSHHRTGPHSTRRMVPVYVVRQSDHRPASVAENHKIRSIFTYGNFGISQNGLGSLGFSHRREEMIYDQLGYRQYSHKFYRQDYPYVGHARLETEWLDAGRGNFERRRIDTTWAHKNKTGADLSNTGDPQAVHQLAQAPFEVYAKKTRTILRDPKTKHVLSTQQIDTTINGDGHATKVINTWGDPINKLGGRTTTENHYSASTIQDQASSYASCNTRTITGLGRRTLAELGRVCYQKVTQTRSGSPRSTVNEMAYAYNDKAEVETEIRSPHKENGATVYHASQYLKTETDRDNFGLLKKSTFSGKDYNRETLQRQTEYHRSYGSSAGYGKQTLVTTNALRQQSTEEFDLIYGNLRKRTDINGLQHQWQYDNFGRETEYSAPDANATTTQYSAVTACEGIAVRGHQVKIKTADRAQPTTQCFDLAGKERVSVRYGFTDNEKIVTTTTYDVLSRVKQRQERHTLRNVTLTTRYEYDRLGRVIKVQTPHRTSHQRTLYDEHTVTRSVMNGGLELSNQQTLYSADGQVVSVKDNVGIVSTPPTTTYNYYAHGQVYDIVSPQGRTRHYYDDLGRQTGMRPPHKTGSDWGYRYNSFGELEWQKEPLGSSMRMKYDKLGRLIERTEPQGESNTGRTYWYYDQHSASSAGKTLGKLLYVKSPTSERLFRYDNLGRVVRERNTIKDYVARKLRTSKYFDTTFEYDSYSRLTKQRSPFGVYTWRHYNRQGNVFKLTNGGGSYTYWQAGEMHIKTRTSKLGVQSDGRHIEQKTLYGYDAGSFTGKPKEVRSRRNGSGSSYFKEQYHWDALEGNLAKREEFYDRYPSQTQAFEYDSFQRLTKVNYRFTDRKTQQSISKSERFEYSLGGDLIKKNNNNYTYDQNRRLSNDGRHQYHYDPAGNYTHGADFKAEWTHFHKPKRLTDKANKHTRFHYDENRIRVFQDSPTETVYYVDAAMTAGTHFEYTTNKQTGKTILRAYLQVNGEAIGVYSLYTDKKGTSGADGPSIRFFLKDYLGSTVRVADSHFKVHDSYAYTAWGQRRWISNPSVHVNHSNSFNYLKHSRHGYTGHEMLDKIGEGLVHMNGRIYHPRMGRFLSPDPVTQFPHSTQGWNKYAYVENNPLRYTDPTGYSIDTSSVQDEDVTPEPATTTSTETTDTGSFGSLNADMQDSEAKTTADTSHGKGTSGVQDAKQHQTQQEKLAELEKEKKGILDRLREFIEDTIKDSLIGFGIGLLSGGLGFAYGAVKNARRLEKIHKLYKDLEEINKKIEKITKPQCFVAGTAIKTTNGAKNIEDIEVGDLVVSRDESTGETTYKPVTQLFVNQNKVVLNLTLIDSDGNTETLGVTEEHPFWIEGKQWVNAADLRAGDRVVTLKGKAQTVHAIDVDAQKHTTYNFEVAEFHTYFVGEHGVWVHNACKPQGGAHGDVKGVPGHESHHMPANSVSPLPKNKGPAVSMEKADHQKTASWGSSKTAKGHRQKQDDLIKQGDFRGAQQMDIDDIRAKFGDKYDDGIQQMQDYTTKLGL